MGSVDAAGGDCHARLRNGVRDPTVSTGTQAARSRVVEMTIASTPRVDRIEVVGLVPTQSPCTRHLSWFSAGRFFCLDGFQGLDYGVIGKL